MEAEKRKQKMDSAGQSEEPDVGVSSVEEGTATASSSSHAGHYGTVDKSRKFYAGAGKPPVKFDFHFPEEVWQIILNMLTEDEDRTNCCRAFPLFDKLLTKSKPLWMFKEILPFLYQTGKYVLERDDVFTCRRVCKTWLDDIQDRVLAPFANTVIEDAHQWYLFNCVEKIDSFSQTFEGHSVNPFVNRHVHVEDYQYFGQETANEFIRKFLDLLSNFGSHIWTLEFNWPGLPGEGIPVALEYYRFFQQILTKTPNLQKLMFWGTKGLQTEIAVELKDEYFSALSSQMKLFPFPPLPELDTLQIMYLSTDEVPESFINMLVLPYATHRLRCLHVDGEIFSQVISHSDYFPKLENLELQEVSNDQELEKLLLWYARLDMLQITRMGPDEGEDDHGGSSLNISTVLRVIKGFPSLEIVRIDNYFIESQAALSHLPNFKLRDFTLSFENESQLPASFNFLQAFKALEKLQVHLPSHREAYFGRDEGEEGVQVFKMLEGGKLYESNIWNLMTTLKTVTIHYKSQNGNNGKIVGTRSCFADHQKSCT